MTHPQVLSDELIGQVSAHLWLKDPISFARAIESATLEAVRGQAVAWAVEYGAVSLPHGDPSRITEWQVHPTKEAAEAAAKAMDFDSRIYPITSPTHPPAQAEREAFEKWASNDGAWPNNLIRSVANPDGYANEEIQKCWECVKGVAALKGQP
jgi:hypothetical protein